MKHRNYFRMFVFGVVVTFILTAWVHGPALAQAKFRIGYAVPLTGTFGRDGNLVKDAYAFWMDLVNAKGGHERKRETVSGGADLSR